MFSKLRARLTYANVVATLALFLALTGGTAVALTGSNAVFSDDITNNQVQSEDVRNDNLSGGGLGSRDIRPNGLTGSDINESALGKVADADKLDGLDSSAFRVRCPAGTRFHEGACFEEAARAAVTWSIAQGVCLRVNRRLPSPAELTNFRLQPSRATPRRQAGRPFAPRTSARARSSSRRAGAFRRPARRACARSLQRRSRRDRGSP
jgi:hypothetical protein